MCDKIFSLSFQENVMHIIWIWIIIGIVIKSKDSSAIWTFYFMKLLIFFLYYEPKCLVFKCS